MMLVWSPFLLLCLVSDKATGKKKKEKERWCSCSRALVVSLGLMWLMTWGLEMLL